MYVCDFRPGHTCIWLPGKIVKCFGPVSYKVQFDNDQIVCRHQDYLQKRSSPALIMTEDTGNPIYCRGSTKTTSQRTQRCPDRYTS